MVLLSSLFTILFQEAEDNGGPWWILGWLIAAGLLALLVSWLLRREGDANETVPVTASAVPSAEAAMPEPVTAENVSQDIDDVPAAEPPAVVETPVKAEEVEVLPVQQDDLARLEGIGPKVASILKEKGIVTFNHLANTEVGTLSEILQEAKLPMLHPDSWPEQARLAAMGDWAALDTLQDSLKGGRRIG